MAWAAGSGFGGELHCGFDAGAAGAFTWTTRLPKARYTAAGSVAGPGTDAGSAPRRVFLEGTDETVLYSVLLSARPDGVLTGYDRERGLAGANDTVVQFRLVTSTDAAVGADAAHRRDLAETLFALRTEALETKTAAVLLEALSVPEVGTYAAFVEASGGQKGAKSCGWSLRGSRRILTPPAPGWMEPCTRRRSCCWRWRRSWRRCSGRIPPGRMDIRCF